LTKKIEELKLKFKQREESNDELEKQIEIPSGLENRIKTENFKIPLEDLLEDTLELKNKIEDKTSDENFINALKVTPEL